jgi:hypothetical protein
MRLDRNDYSTKKSNDNSHKVIVERFAQNILVRIVLPTSYDFPIHFVRDTPLKTSVVRPGVELLNSDLKFLTYNPESLIPNNYTMIDCHVQQATKVNKNGEPHNYNVMMFTFSNYVEAITCDNYAEALDQLTALSDYSYQTRVYLNYGESEFHSINFDTFSKNKTKSYISKTTGKEVTKTIPRREDGEITTVNNYLVLISRS